MTSLSPDEYANATGCHADWIAWSRWRLLSDARDRARRAWRDAGHGYRRWRYQDYRCATDELLDHEGRMPPELLAAIREVEG